MMWLAVLACTGDTLTGDSGTTGIDSGTAGPTGTLTAEPGVALVTSVTLTGTFDAETPLTLTCEGAGEHQVPEIHLWRSTDDSDTHSAWLGGLLADTEYTCSATGLSRVAPVSFKTGPLPTGLLNHTLTLETWETGAESGWTLINPWTFVSVDEHVDAYLVVVDMEGRVRWYYATEEEGIVAFDLDVEARTLWTGGGLRDVYEPTAIREDATVSQATSSHATHDVDWVGDDAWALVHDASGTCLERREWATDTLVDSVCTGELGLRGMGWNSVDVARVDDGHVFYAGSATSNRVVKVHMENKQLLWTFGPDHDFVGNITLDYTHDVNAFGCDGFDVCLSFYDNGLSAESSAAQIFGLDEQDQVAVSLRSWSEPGWYEPRMGGLQVLESGNLLIGAGHAEPIVPDSPESAVIEVGPDDSVVWRLTITPDTSAIYRARRVAPCDLFGHAGYCPDLGE